MKYALRTKLGKWLPNLHQYRQWNFQYQQGCIFDYSANDTRYPPVQWQFNNINNMTTTFLLGNFEQKLLDSTQCIPVFPDITTSMLQIKLPLRTPLETIIIDSPAIFDPFDHVSEYTRNLQPTSFATLLQSEFISIYVGQHQLRSKLSIGWLIYANDTVLYQGKLRLLPTSADCPLRGVSQCILAALMHYTHEYEAHHCPIPKQNITIYTCNQQVTVRLDQQNRYVSTASKQFKDEHEAIASICIYMNELPACNIKYLPVIKHTIGSIHNQRLAYSQKHAINAIDMYMETDIVELPFKHCTSTLRINRMEIPSNLKNELRNTALSPDLRIFFHSKYKWTSSTIDSIDWQVHSKALNQQHPYSRKTITQFIHRWLPTHAHHGTKKDITTKCPICHLQDESNDHFLICDSTEIKDEWTKQVQLLYDEMTVLQMDPILLYYLTLAITTWKIIANPTNPEFIQIEVYDTLFKEQSKIGWNHVIYGRFSTAWVDIQNQYDHSKDDGIFIISMAIGKIYKIVYHIWKTRCDFKYRKINQPVYRTNILHPKVQELYDKQETLDALGKLYFERPIINIFEQKIPYIHQWLKKADEIICQSIERTQQQLRRIPTIDSYFPRRIRPTPTTKNRVVNKNNPPVQETIQNLDETRPLPPPLPDPGDDRNALITFLNKPP